MRGECLNMHVFKSVAEAQVVLAAYRRQYKEERPHSSLGYRTLQEFAALASTNQAGQFKDEMGQGDSIAIPLPHTPIPATNGNGEFRMLR